MTNLLKHIKKLLGQSPSAPELSPDRLDPEDLRERLQAARDHAQRFVGQECVFREKFIIALGTLTALEVDDKGFRARVTQSACEGFFPFPRDPIEVGSAWLKEQGGIIGNAMIFGGSYTAYVVYSNPEVVREARRIAGDLSDADPDSRRTALMRYLNRVDMS